MTTALLAKGALGALVVGGTVTTCVLVYSARPTCISIGDSTNNQDTTYTGKLGEDFKFHFVSTKDPNNIAWWDWVFKNLWKTDEDSAKDAEFKGLDGSKKLKDKCEEAYKKTTKGEVNGTGKDTYEKNVWRYCSVENKRPVIVKDADSSQKEAGTGESESAKIGKSNETKLVSTLSKDNDWFWKLQEKSFFKQTKGTSEVAGIGSKATESDSTFKTLYEKTSRGENDTLRKTCETTYGEENSASTKKNDALLFCSLQAAKDS